MNKRKRFEWSVFVVFAGVFLLFFHKDGPPLVELLSPTGISEEARILRAHHKGRGMTAGEAEAAEQQLAGDPTSKTTRATLIGYHGRHAPERAAELVLEWIEEDPASVPSSVGRIDAVSQPAAYRAACVLWLKQVELYPDDIDVLRNASALLGQKERERAKELLRRGEELMPEDPHWADRIGRLLLRGTPRRGVFDTPVAADALTALERAITLHQVRSEAPSHALLLFAANAALQAGEIERAREYAETALDILAQTAEGWGSRSRPNGRDLHVAHLVLGLVAVRQDQLEQAETHLLSSAPDGGGPILNTFGPNMLLARELVDRGRCDAVLDYFRRCGRFWDDPRLGTWAADVEQGRTPNFGANLSYCL